MRIKNSKWTFIIVFFTACSLGGANYSDGIIKSKTEYNPKNIKVKNENFNNKGNIVEKTEFTEDGNIHSKINFRYDSNDNIVESLEGTSNKMITNLYDDKGRILLSEEKNTKDTFKIVYSYDDENNSRIDTNYRNNEVVYSNFDEGDNIIYQYTLNQNRDTISKIYSKYDSENRLLENKKFESGRLSDLNIYKYDNKGNLLEEIFITSNSANGNRTVHIYNENNRLIKSTIYKGQSNDIDHELEFKYIGNERMDYRISENIRKKTGRITFTYYPK